MPDRQVPREEDAASLGVDPNHFKDCSYAEPTTSRGVVVYDRTFREAFIRRGIGLENVGSRSNCPTVGIV